MPRLPTGHYKIAIRLRGVLQIFELNLTELDKAVYEASEIRYEEREMDTICPNNFQNILVVSTPNQEHADKYQGNKHINANDKVYEVVAYETAPGITVKGVTRKLPLEETPRDITAAVITPRNPTAITAKHLGNTTRVIVLFDGYRVASHVLCSVRDVRYTEIKWTFANSATDYGTAVMCTRGQTTNLLRDVERPIQTWRMLKHLLNPDNTKSDHRQTLRMLVHEYKGSEEDFAEAIATHTSPSTPS
ncbi:hypothetical protein HPB49_009626 [Dermacentor silvarum]|uniref:Uncharacterized protein n=1 Tax=Dermacentor silvarum TaxID=543639 RepID=A0ACB8CX02_DERSI|nr:hypothetical protein HPB49_009626 [Dermacentor silvarum]